MSKTTLTALALAATLFVSGCATLEPALPLADAAIQSEWPLPPDTGVAAGSSESTQAVNPDNAPGPTTGFGTADIGWRDFFVDPNLEELIARALSNNRDLRVAALNVRRARAQYRIQRADRVPSLAVSASNERTGGSDLPVTDSYSAGLELAEFELDLFGRVRNLSEAALETYLASDEARRSTQLSLIAEVANAYLTLAADHELLRVAQDTLKTQERSYALTAQRHVLGAVSALDLNQTRTQVETARSDAARYTGQIAQDINALTLLVGAPIEAELLPGSQEEAVTGLTPLPAGLPSEVLLRRPDVLAAEHQLRAENANIGAARAAFFPSITLTGSVGSASDQLSGLFDSGTRAWSFIPRLNLPIFQGGRLRAQLRVATVDRDIALARYEKAIQAGFREVADALALSATLDARRQAQESLVEAAMRSDEISRDRYDAGRDSSLVRLDAQRTLYAAQQGLINTRLIQQSNRVTLYKALGGGWIENGP